MIVGVIAVAVIAGGVGYVAGTKSASAQSATAGTQRGFSRGAGGPGGGGGRFGGGGAAFGTVVSKDATSITVQLTGPAASSSQNGTGSKIVLYDTSTQVGEFKTGSINDIAVGQSVSVQGSANSDGSITAQSIQIRPAGQGPRGGGQ